MTDPSYAVLSVLLVSAVSFIGAFIFLLSRRTLDSAIFWLVSFATGAILGNVFFHIFPEIFEHGAGENVFLLLLLGVLVSFVIEKFIHWHHCHNLNCHERSHTVGSMVLIGDGVHNITDGMLIGTAYLVDVQLGIATTIAVILHEIPQEIGDFAILLHGGYSKMKALLWNFVSALGALLGVVFILLLHETVEGIELLLLPVVAGNFLYIALADLVPELHRESRLDRAFLQFLFVIAGALLLFWISGSVAHDEAHGIDDIENEMHDVT